MEDQIKNSFKEWLGEFNKTPMDVIHDPDGRNYISVEMESGNPGDDYDVSDKKIYLPDEFQLLV